MKFSFLRGEKKRYRIPSAPDACLYGRAVQATAEHAVRAIKTKAAVFPLRWEARNSQT